MIWEGIRMGPMFFITNIGLGISLAMDAFSVSLANGLNEPQMKTHKMCAVSGVFAIFQALMPFIGWVCLHTILQYFTWFEGLIPWIALILLSFIGGKMIYDGAHPECDLDGNCTCAKLTFGALIVQGIATSIDALSAGFTLAEYNLILALVAVSLIAIVTFIICMGGIFIGKKAGNKLQGKACIFGGVILILIGIEIFVSGVFFS